MKLKSRISGDVLKDLGDFLLHCVGGMHALPPPPQFKTAHDIALFICRHLPTVAEQAVCPTLTSFHHLRSRLAQFTEQDESTITPRTVLKELLPGRRDWQDFKAFLHTNAPDKSIGGGLSLAFIVAMTFQCVFLPAWADFRTPFEQILFLSLVLSSMEVFALWLVVRLIVPGRPLAHLHTVGDLACYLALFPETKRPKGAWSASEVRQLIRYSIDQSLGESVSSIKLRREYTSWT